MSMPHVIEGVREELSRRGFLGLGRHRRRRDARRCSAETSPLPKGFREVFDLTHPFSPKLLIARVQADSDPAARFSVARDGFCDSKACPRRVVPHREKQSAVGDFGGAPLLGSRLQASNRRQRNIKMIRAGRGYERMWNGLRQNRPPHSQRLTRDCLAAFRRGPSLQPNRSFRRCASSR
jgi:hypothetical protein